MSEHRTPELKALLSDVDKRLKEAEKKAYIDPVKAEDGNQKGNEFFKNGNFLFNIIKFSLLKFFLL